MTSENNLFIRFEFPAADSFAHAFAKFQAFSFGFFASVNVFSKPPPSFFISASMGLVFPLNDFTADSIELPIPDSFSFILLSVAVNLSFR